MALVNANRNAYGVGAVARWGPLYRGAQNSFFIVKTDLESGELYRDPVTGFCKQADIGEVGESICRILAPVQQKHRYIGPGGEQATEKKTLRNVFEQGDEFFRIGDALMMVLPVFVGNDHH